jgi:hypothetical protein
MHRTCQETVSGTVSGSEAGRQESLSNGGVNIGLSTQEVSNNKAIMIAPPFSNLVKSNLIFCNPPF